MDKEFLKWLKEELKTQVSDFEFLKEENKTLHVIARAEGQIAALENVKEQVALALYREAME